jgi:hypothetical protein
MLNYNNVIVDSVVLPLLCFYTSLLSDSISIDDDDLNQNSPITDNYF